ncbi:hypothetical protein D8B26_003208 [Coccidioides posadasii str. Silveira]|uniref:uncharacterized protein n=1 Tax=Coccidioides posadasii (strain RMSCC 757 / Silveira) TaxID=443226 RepID=UPI001BF13BDC|nr:hypothetical protein D8B26_003208 [Coccidioides posadasii str. Silveira]
MALVDLDNLQFYFPPPLPPGYRPSSPVMGHPSVGKLMLNGSDCTVLSTAAVPVTTPSPEQLYTSESLDHLPPFHPTLASQGSPWQKQRELMLPWVTLKDFNQVLEVFGIAKIETVDLTSDDPTSQAPLPSISLPNLEGDFDDKSSYVPQSPGMNNSDSMVSTRLASLAGLLDTTLDEPRSGSQCDPVTVGSSCDVDAADAQLMGFLVSLCLPHHSQILTLLLPVLLTVPPIFPGSNSQPAYNCQGTPELKWVASQRDVESRSSMAG